MSLRHRYYQLPESLLLKVLNFLLQIKTRSNLTTKKNRSLLAGLSL